MFGVRCSSPSIAFIVTAGFALTGVLAFGQDVISARSGLVHYVEGDVSIDGQPVAVQNGTFSEVKKDGELATSMGRAEVLLTPGVFLRVGENSSIRMRETALDDTKVGFVGGKTMLESDTPMKDNRVTIVYKDYAVTPVTYGIFEFSSEPAALEVYSGEADVTAGGQTVRVKAGKKLIFTAALAQEHFNNKDGDSLYRWSKLRSEYVSVANLSAARQAQTNGYSSGYNSAPGMGSWYYNSFYDMYTFLPFGGVSFSPFGYGFYSPGAFGQYYNYGNYGYNGYNPGGGSSSSTGGTGTKPGTTSGGWQRSLNHPYHPTPGAVVASVSHSSSGSSGGSTSTSSSSWGLNAPAPSYGSGVSNGSNAIGHIGGGAPSAGASHGK